MTTVLMGIHCLELVELLLIVLLVQAAHVPQAALSHPVAQVVNIN
jgi:hypothetical protein